jgi:hypothetical protein
MKLRMLLLFLIYCNFTFSQNTANREKMKNLLKEISIKAIELGDLEYTKMQIDSSWIGYSPVRQKEIEKTEKRLRISLPQDYKDFLMLTNGFQATSNVEPSFAGCNKIDFLRNVDNELCQIWIKDGVKEVGHKLKTAIKVGGFDEEQYFFLIPPSNNNPNWEYWVFASWSPGETIFHSLYEYFQFVLETTIEFLEEKKQSE